MYNLLKIKKVHGLAQDACKPSFLCDTNAHNKLDDFYILRKGFYDVLKKMVFDIFNNESLHNMLKGVNFVAFRLIWHDC